MGSLKEEDGWLIYYVGFMLYFYLLDVQLYLMMITAIIASEFFGVVVDVVVSTTKQFRELAALDKAGKAD